MEKLIDSHRLYYKGEEDPAVNSCRVRLARNLSEHFFVSRMGIDQRRNLLKSVSETILAKLGGDFRLLTRDNTKVEERRLLEELNLIPEKFFDPDGYRGIIIGGGAVSILINEEDHIRIQAFCSGKALSELYRMALKIDELMEGVLGKVAFSKRWGYLTACLTNVGTGLRASVMVHLPALSLTKQISKLTNACRALGYTIRGPHGEGSDLAGNLYQLSNQRTMGLSEEEIINGVIHMADRMGGFEGDCRRQLLGAMREVMEDKVFRALGVVNSARMISSGEAAGLLSAIRLGLEWKFFDGAPKVPINELLDNIKPTHLSRLYGEKIGGRDAAQRRDILRARYLRESLKDIKTALSN